MLINVLKVFFLVFAISQPVYAQTGSDSMQLQGQVLDTCLVDVDPTAQATNLDLISSGHTHTKVADVHIFSSSLAMATAIGINDTTGSELHHTTNPSYKIPYNLDYYSPNTGNHYSNISVPLNTATILDFKIGSGDFDSELFINIAPDATLPEGVYETTVTISCSII